MKAKCRAGGGGGGGGGGKRGYLPGPQGIIGACGP